MRTSQLAPHETLELHEIVRSEVTCAKKIQASMDMVEDSDLKSFMDRSLQAKKDNLNRFQQFLNASATLQQ